MISRLLPSGLIALSLLTASLTTLAQSNPQTPPPKPPATLPAKPARPAGAATAPAEPVPTQRQYDPASTDSKWLERLPKEDREAIDALVGYAPPPFSSDLKWLDASALSWDAMRGKVVVLQSWTTANMAGRKWPARIAEQMKDFNAKDVRVIALHTPEEAAGAEDFMKKQKPPEGVNVVIDSKGEFCDKLGVFKQAVNIVIDRCGSVRYAGLNANGLDKAVAELVKEPFDQKKRPTPFPEETKTESVAAKFPTYTGSVGNAVDFRGKKAPAFAAAQWITKKPNPDGKVVVIDFWATWCGPCRAAIPHMNALASRFGDKVCCIGISDESKSNFEDGFRKHKLDLDQFQYNLALDPNRRMANVLKITGIPHCIVMSKDWVVRWQGHPAGLTEETLDQIVQADSGSSPSKLGGKKRGWSAG